jgi:hypothetical protein
MNPSIAGSQFASFGFNRAWVGAVQNQVCTSCSIGLCDDILCQFVRGAEAWAYDTVFINWKLGSAAGGDADAAGAPIILTAGAQYDAFSETGGGVDQGTMVGGWFVKGLNYTDLLNLGTPVDQNFAMTVCGAAVRVGLPRQRLGLDGTQGAASDSQLLPDWLNPADDGNNTGAKAQIETLEACSLRLKVGDMGLVHYLGTVYLFPSFATAHGRANEQNGQVCYPFGYTPFAVCFCIGSQFDLKRATIVVQVENNTSIESAAAGLATKPPGEGLDGTVYVPLQIFLFGYVCCFDSQSLCGGLTFAEQDVLRAFIVQNGLMPAAPGAPAQIGATAGLARPIVPTPG